MTCYRLPKLIDINAKSRLIRDKDRLMIISRCIELEHPDILKPLEAEYALLTSCPEEEHVNQLGFKLLGILGRGNYKEVGVLTIDGSMHCIQLHYLLEELFKMMKPEIKRRHMILHRGQLVEVSPDTVKTSRFLYRVDNLIKNTRQNTMV